MYYPYLCRNYRKVYKTKKHQGRPAKKSLSAVEHQVMPLKDKDNTLLLNGVKNSKLNIYSPLKK